MKAKEARELSNLAIQNDREFKSLINYIKAYANNGQTSCDYYGKISPRSLDKLLRLGYCVTYKKGKTTISW